MKLVVILYVSPRDVATPGATPATVSRLPRAAPSADPQGPSTPLAQSQRERTQTCEQHPSFSAMADKNQDWKREEDDEGEHEIDETVRSTLCCP